MRILMVEPFFSGSHAQWMKGFQAHSQHDIQFLTLPGRHWKWRMLGGAIPLAEQFMSLQDTPDLILVSDMLDLSTFLALTRERSQGIPVVMYFHENQLTYPWSPQDRDLKSQRFHYFALTNFTSALLADRLLFNSKFHLTSFFEALPPFLKSYPDHQCLEYLPGLQQKSEVFYLGLELPRPKPQVNAKPVILWNHRWDFDKGPEAFLNLLSVLKVKNIPFELLLLGESLESYPKAFDTLQSRFSDALIYAGYAPSQSEYFQYLRQATLLPVTSIQDFFGISIAEAIAAGVTPLLPDRLAYPELIPASMHGTYLYQGESELLQKTVQFLSRPHEQNTQLMQHIRQFEWKNCIQAQDTRLETWARTLH